MLQWYNNNVILWKLGAKPMRTGRRCADSHGGGKTETAKKDGAHEAVTFMAPYKEIEAFIEQVHSVYPKEAGMDEHLSKPVDIAALEQTVKRFRVAPPH